MCPAGTSPSDRCSLPLPVLFDNMIEQYDYVINCSLQKTNDFPAPSRIQETKKPTDTKGRNLFDAKVKIRLFVRHVPEFVTSKNGLRETFAAVLFCTMKMKMRYDKLFYAAGKLLNTIKLKCKYRRMFTSYRTWFTSSGTSCPLRKLPSKIAAHAMGRGRMGSPSWTGLPGTYMVLFPKGWGAQRLSGK